MNLILPNLVFFQLWNVFKDFICCRHCCCSSRRGTPSPTNEGIADVELRLKIKDVFDIDLLPKKKWQGTENDNGSIRACSICQEDFVKNQELRTLPCEHGKKYIHIHIYGKIS